MSIELSPKLHQIDEGVLVHWCPGCKMLHPIYLDVPARGSKPKWQWDGNVEAPTFSPSVIVTGMGCHYYLKKGVIDYLSDCKHAFANQGVPLPDIPEGEDW